MAWGFLLLRCKNIEFQAVINGGERLVVFHTTNFGGWG